MNSYLKPVSLLGMAAAILVLFHVSFAQEEDLSDEGLKAKFQNWAKESVAKVPKDANPWHAELIRQLTARMSDKMYSLCVKSQGVDRNDCWEMMIRYSDRMISQPVEFGYLFFSQKYDFLLSDKDRIWLLDYYSSAPDDKGKWPFKWVRFVGLAGEEEQEKLPLVMSAFMVLDGIRHRAFGPGAFLKLNVSEQEFVTRADKFLNDFLKDSGSLLLENFLKGIGMKEDVAAGAHVFFVNCFRCHSPYGDGKGPQEFANGKPLPRDYRDAEFKFKSTPIGSLPLDEDLIRTVTRGIPRTPMPSFDQVLKPQEIQNVVQFVKTFSPRFSTETPAMNPELFPPPPEMLKPIADPKLRRQEVLKGKILYAKLACWECHGALGRGDGPSGQTLVDRTKLFLAPPPDMSNGIPFKSGPELKDLMRTIALGIEGSGMPEYPTEALLAPIGKADLVKPDNPAFPTFTEEELAQVAALFPNTDGLSPKQQAQEAHARRRAMALFAEHLNTDLSVALRKWREERIVKNLKPLTVRSREAKSDTTVPEGGIGQILQVERIEDGTESGKVFILVRFFVEDNPVVVGFSEIPPRAPADYQGEVDVKDLQLLEQGGTPPPEKNAPAPEVPKEK